MLTLSVGGDWARRIIEMKNCCGGDDFLTGIGDTRCAWQLVAGGGHRLKRNRLNN